MSMPYKVAHYPGVAEKMRALADLASLAGIRRHYLDALRTMARRLQDDPLGWGDPLYRTHIQGGIVCSGLIDPIVVRFVVHEPEKVVLVIDIKPLFQWLIRP
jgi:hypothetical protein